MIPDPALPVAVLPDPTSTATVPLQETTAAGTTTTAAAADGTARLLPTLGVIAALAVALLAVRYAGRRLREDGWFDSDRVATAEAALTTGLFVAAAGVVLFLWHDVTPVGEAIDRFRPDPLFGVRVVVTLLLAAGAYGLTRVLARIVKQRDPGDGGTPPSVDHRREVAFYLTQVGVYTTVALVVLAFWQVNLGNLLVGAGFLGIVLGLAARQTLGAAIAGFVLLFARHFEVGDWVVIGDREGVVTDVNVVHTRLRTFDGEQVVIPNDRVADRDVVNRSREGRLRVTQEVGVDYDADVGRAVEVARGAIRECEADPLLSAPGPQVVAKRFGDSAVVLELRFWISTPTARRMWRTRTAVTEAVKEAFDREGIAIPFPQRTVSGRAGSPVGVEGAATAEGAPPPGETAVDGGVGADDSTTAGGVESSESPDGGIDADEATTDGESAPGGEG